jgi:hypothetical protein
VTAGATASRCYTGVILRSVRTGRRIFASCRSPRCERGTCAAEAGRLFAERVGGGLRRDLKAGARLVFLTLTFRSEFDATTPCLEALAIERDMRRRFSQRVKRLDGTAVLAWVREIGTRGRLHAHLVLRSSLSMRKLKRNARAAGYGYAYPVLVRDGARLADYLAKYVAKPNLGRAAWPAGTRWMRSVYRRPRHSSVWCWWRASASAVETDAPDAWDYAVRPLSRGYEWADEWPRPWSLCDDAFRDWVYASRAWVVRMGVGGHVLEVHRTENDEFATDALRRLGAAIVAGLIGAHGPPRQYDFAYAA